MRLCLIGDSQLGALKLALDEGLVDTQGHEISFFAAVAGKSARFKYDGAKLVPARPEDVTFATQGRFHSIGPADFDALVFYGMGLGFDRWLRAPDTDTPRRYSRAFLDAAFHARMVNATGIRLAASIAAAPHWPKTLVICPAPAQAAPKSGQVEGECMIPAADFTAQALAICAAIGAQFIAQPAETLQSGYYTQNHYAIGSRRFIPAHPEHPKEDRNHMNASYGALMLRDILAALG